MKELIQIKLLTNDSKEYITDVKLPSIPSIESKIKFNDGADDIICTVKQVLFIDGGNVEISVSIPKNNDNNKKAKDLGGMFH